MVQDYKSWSRSDCTTDYQVKMPETTPAALDDITLQRVRNLDVNTFAGMKRKYGQISLAEAGKELPQLGAVTDFKSPAHSQLQSRLVSLPQELRSMLYDLIFTEYETTTEEEPKQGEESRGYQYPLDSPLRRPGYTSPPRISITWTQTCQSIYKETWWMPFQHFHHTFYKCSSEPSSLSSHPSSYSYDTHLSRIWAALLPITQRRLSIPAAWHNNELRQVQVFISASCLEESCCLSDMMDISSFNPRRLTITVRHVGQWRWQQDQSLRISSRGLFRDTEYPTSLVELDLQFESLRRKKDQIDYLTSEVARVCSFKKYDGTLLVPVRDRVATMMWQGSSTWDGVRWVGDENNEQPGLLTYYVSTIPFRPLSPHDTRTYGTDRREIPHHIQCQGAPTRHGTKHAFTLGELDSINVDRNTPKDAVLWKWARKQERERSSAAVVMLAMLSAGGS